MLRHALDSNTKKPCIYFGLNNVTTKTKMEQFQNILLDIHVPIILLGNIPHHPSPPISQQALQPTHHQHAIPNGYRTQSTQPAFNQPCPIQSIIHPRQSIQTAQMSQRSNPQIQPRPHPSPQQTHKMSHIQRCYNT